MVRTFKKYGIKWNVVGKSGLKGDRLLTVTLGVSEEIEIGKLGNQKSVTEIIEAFGGRYGLQGHLKWML